MSDSIRKAVFPVAGLGTRFLPATKSVPKELLPIYDIPAIDRVLDECLAAGITEILFITGRNKTALEDYFDRNVELESVLAEKGRLDQLALVKRISDRVAIHSVRQGEALGLGHAVLCAESFVGDEPFMVFLPDDIVHSESGRPSAASQMIRVYEEKRSSVIALEAVPRDRVSSYGVMDGAKVADRLYRMKAVVEKPAPDAAPSNLTIVGRYIFTPAIFSHLRATKRGRGGEIQLTDAIMALIAEEDVLGYEFEGRRYDTGEPVGYIEAVIEYALRSPEGGKIREYLKSLEL